MPSVSRLARNQTRSVRSSAPPRSSSARSRSLQSSPPIEPASPDIRALTDLGLNLALLPPFAVVTTKDAARLLGRSERVLEGWRLTGRGPAYCRIGKRIAYKIDDLRAFIDAHRVVTD